MMKAATDMWGNPTVPAGFPQPAPEAAPEAPAEDVKALKAELQALQAKIEKLAKE